MQNISLRNSCAPKTAHLRQHSCFRALPCRGLVPCKFAVRGRTRPQRWAQSHDTDALQEVTKGDSQPKPSSAALPAVWQQVYKGIALLPLLGVALLAPSAAHATWRHATAPVPDAISVGMVSNEELAGLHEARGFQYPLWQRLQWLGVPEEDPSIENVIVNGPERDIPGAIQDTLSPAWHRVKWLLQNEGQNAELARTRFFAAVTGSAVLLALLLRYAVSLTDSTTHAQSRSATTGDSSSGGSSGPGQAGSNNADMGPQGGAADLAGAAGASSAAAVMTRGNITRSSESDNRPQLGPQTRGGSIGGSDLHGGLDVFSIGTAQQAQVAPTTRTDKDSKSGSKSSSGARIVPRPPPPIPRPPIVTKPRFVKSAPVQFRGRRAKRPADDSGAQSKNAVQQKPQLVPGSQQGSASTVTNTSTVTNSMPAPAPPMVPDTPQVDYTDAEKHKADEGISDSDRADTYDLGATSLGTAGHAVFTPQDRKDTSTKHQDAARAKLVSPTEEQDASTDQQKSSTEKLDPSDDMDVADIGALAAEVASSGGGSIFGDSGSLDDLAKEVVGLPVTYDKAADFPGESPVPTSDETSSAADQPKAAYVGASAQPELAADVATPQVSKAQDSSVGSGQDSVLGTGTGTQVSAQSSAPTRESPGGISAANTMQLTMGLFARALSALARPSMASRSGRPVMTERRGESLTAAFQPAATTATSFRTGLSDSSLTLAQRAESSLKDQSRPLRGLLRPKRAKQGRPVNLEKYDLFHEALEASASRTTDGKFAPLRSILEAVPPAGPAKYDMVSNLLRGAVSDQARGAGVRSKYDVVWQLLASGRQTGATSKPKFDPVYDLMGTAAMVADWGHSAQPFGGWGLDIYDPLQLFGDIKAPTLRSKYDPLQDVLAAEAPSGSSKYDMVGEILAAGAAAEANPPTGGPVIGVIDWLRTVVGIDRGPSGFSPFDPVTHLMAARQPSAPSGDQKYDIMSWLRQISVKPKSSPTGTTVIKPGRSQLALQNPGKYDPASPLLGWLNEPLPTADDPLRAFIRRAAQGTRESSDIAIRPALVYNSPSTGGEVLVPLEYKDQDSAPSGRSRWPWSARGKSKSSSGDDAGIVESPFNAQLAAATPSSEPPPLAVARAQFDPVPELLKLWNALAASSAQLDPLDAVNVIANRGAGPDFFGVAQAFRRLVDDRALRERGRAVWDLAKTTQGRSTLPPVSAEAARGGEALVRQLQRNPAYEPLAAILKGKSSKEVVSVMCVLYDLLLSPARPLPQLQPYDQAVAA